MRYRYTDSARISEARIEEALPRLAGIVERMAALEPGAYAMPEAGIAAALDGMQVEIALRIKAEMGSPQHVVLIGIGGSSIGTEAVYSALKNASSPTLTVLDVVDAERVEAVAEMLKAVEPADFVIVIVSKSGTTTETIANASVLLSILTERHGDALRERVIMIGDAQTPLARYAKKARYRYAQIPARVGGRFSLFTAAGLVPLALLNIDIRVLHAGAEKRIRGEWEGSGAVRAALVHYFHGSDGRHTHMLFAGQERLTGLTRWYEQLLAESLGKEKTRAGWAAPRPPAPHLMSPRELHSTAQLYLSGFPETFTTFFEAAATGERLPLEPGELGALLSMKAPRDYVRISPAILDGVRQAYATQSLPYATVDLERLNAESLGACLAERMLEVIYIAELMDVDAFDQPHVELYKSETRRILG